MRTGTRFLLFVAMAACCAVAADDYTQWSSYRTIYLNTNATTGANVPDTVRNFPVLVRLTSTEWPTGAKSDGTDIRFAKADGTTHLYYERERWDNSGQLAEFWVRVDTVFGTTTRNGHSSDSTTIRMYWGKNDAADSSNGSAVFDTAQGYLAAYHLNEDPSTGTANAIKDRTANAFNCTSNRVQSGHPYPSQIDGMIGKAVNFSQPDSQWLAAANPATVGKNLTISLWYSPLGAPYGSTPVSLKLSGTPAARAIVYELNWVPDSAWNIYNDESSEWARMGLQGVSHVEGNQWHHVVYTIVQDSLLSLYDNNSLYYTTSGYTKVLDTNITDGSFDIIMGRTGGYSQKYAGGMVDEVQISKVARSSNWVQLSYENQKSGQTLVDFGSTFFSHDDYSSWTKSQTIYLNTNATTGANVTDTVRNFPVLVRLTSSNWPTGALSTGNDIRFAKPDGTHLYYERERWDNSAQLAEFWVRVDTVYGTTDRNGHTSDSTTIKMLWGNNSAGDSSNAQAVFDTANGFWAVYHLSEEATGKSGANLYQDATPNNYDGDDSITSTDRTGMIGYGHHFDTSSTDYIPSTSFAFPSDSFGKLSVSFWSRFQLQGNWIGIVGKDAGDQAGFYVQRADAHNPGNLSCLLRTSPATRNECYSATTVGDGGATWSYSSVTWTAGDSMRFRIDAGTAAKTATPSGRMTKTANKFMIGRFANVGATYVHGDLDEMRIEKVARSLDWIKLCYENQRASQTLVNFGGLVSPHDDYTQWSSYRNIYLNTNATTGANVTDTVRNFPVLVRLTSVEWPTTALSTGYDIRFAKPDGTHLYYERERWDNAGQLAEFWVRVDTVYGKTDRNGHSSDSTAIKMLWGNSSAGDSSNAQAVFDTANGFAGVWHLKESTGTGARADATRNANDLSPSATNVQATGIIGYADSSNGNYLSIADASCSSLNITDNTITLTAWVKGFTVNTNLMSKDDWGANSSSYGFQYPFGCTGEITAKTCVTGSSCIGPWTGSKASTSGWNYLGFTYNGQKVWSVVNGVIENTYSQTDTIYNSTAPFALFTAFSNGSPVNSYNGVIDEAVVSSVARDTNWLRLCYENQKASQTLVDFDIVVPPHDDYSQWSNVRTIYLNANATTGANVTDTVRNFPVLVRLTSSDWPTGALSTGYDIRFAKPDGTHLYYEREQWVDGSAAAFWVRVDTVYGTTDRNGHTSDSTEIRMLWGKNDAPDSSNGAATFSPSNGFVGVWHLKEGTSATRINSAQPGTYDGTVSNYASNRIASVNGMIGVADSIDSAGSGIFAAARINVGDIDFSGTNKITMSLWFKLQTWTERGFYPRFFAKDNDANTIIYGLTFSTNAIAEFQVYNGTTTGWVQPGTINADTWVYLTGTYDGSLGSNQMKAYLNTTVSNGTLTGNIAEGEAGHVAHIAGDNYGRNDYGRAVFDECRIENVSRSADWVKLCYGNQRPASEQTLVDQGSTFSLNLLPVTIRRTSGTATDTCLIYTNNWSLVFKEATGGGITWLSDSSQCKGTNNVTSGQNLFYLKYGTGSPNTSYNATGVLTLLDSNSLYAKIRQEVTLSSRPFTVDYLVQGSGRIYARAYTQNATSSDIIDTLRFMVNKKKIGTVVVRPRNVPATRGTAMLFGDNGTRAHDVLIAPYDTLGRWTPGVSYDTTALTATGGWRMGPDTIKAKRTDAWHFMVDFGQRNWNDSSSSVWQYADNYRAPDSLEFLKGTLGMEKAWESELRGQWQFEEPDSDHAVYDLSGYTTANNGIIRGTGTSWRAAGKLGRSLSFSGDDTVAVADAGNLFGGAYGFTAMSWVNPAATPGATTMLFGRYNGTSGYKVTGTASNGLLLYLDADTMYGNITLPTSQWHHVAVSWDYHSRDAVFYYDGHAQKIGNNQYWRMTAPAGQSLYFGASLNGQMDDVRYYNQRLSANTIRAIVEKGFRPDEGMYMVRASNNGTVHFAIDGGNVPRSLPVFQVSNWWWSTSDLKVYLNNAELTSGTDYVASVDNVWHLLYIGLNKQVYNNGALVYIDNNDAAGASCVTPVKSMVWGKYLAPSHFWVKNFSGSSFSSATANEFFIDWKMATTPTVAKGGEIFRMKTSAISGATADTATTGNIIPALAGVKGSFGYYELYKTSRRYPSTDSVKVFSTPDTYTVAESSAVRVRLTMNPRTLGTVTFYGLKTIWTIYPTGQIFRWDSAYGLSAQADSVFFRAREINASPTNYVSDPKWRGGMYGAATNQDVAVAFMSSSKYGGADTIKNLYTGRADTVLNEASASNYSGIRFAGSTVWPTSKTYQTAFYMDIQRSGMNQAYVDSVSNGVQYIIQPTMTNGSLLKHSKGDLDTNGFNESEGAYVFSATSNGVQFKLSARGDTCRFYPAFRVTNYYAPSKPMFVYLFDTVAAGGDTMPLVEGYHYSCYYNRDGHELVMQLDTVLCKSTNVYISEDDDLAITLSDFWARPGNGHDTLFWRTESEHEHLGFYLYRRIVPHFLDSLSKIDVTMPDSLLDRAALLYKKGKGGDNTGISAKDTAWVRVLNKMIPGVRGGTSVGQRNYRMVDYQVQNGVLYEYTLESVDYDNDKQTYGPIQVRPGFLPPTRFMLWNNYPNPFKRYTTIKFDVPIKTKVSLCVYNLQGQLINELISPDKKMDPGWYKAQWNGKNIHGRPVASGPYIYRLVAAKYAKAKVMMLVK